MTTAEMNRAMKFRTILSAILLSAAATVHAATNDLSSAMQQGFFEEQANHNLPKAIEAYKAVIDQFDRERKLVAIAVFHLGECFRSQGNTNQAITQYRRVLREFADQKALVTQARQNLATLGAAAILPADTASTNIVRQDPKPLPEDDDIKRITAMLKDSPDLINAKSELSKGATTPLQQAAIKGQLAAAELLLANGADVGARDGAPAGRTALHYAAAAGHNAIVELLLDHHADPRAVDASANCPLHLASEKGFQIIVEALLEHGAEVNAKTKSGTTPLHLAVVNGFKTVVETLLDRGADVNALTSGVKPSSGSGNDCVGTPLHLSLWRGDTDLAALLLAHGADPNRTNDLGQTPLQLAADQGQISAVRLLLAHGAVVDAKSAAGGRPGWTALHYAIERENKEIAALLLDHKADPDARLEIPSGPTPVEQGATPLLMAVRKFSGDLVELLLTHNADPNLSRNAGSLPLADALSLPGTHAQRTRIVSLLLEHGAQVNSSNPAQSSTPLLVLATETRDKETVDLLLEHKADVKAADAHRNTALHWAVYECDPEKTSALLNHGADPNALNEFGATPLHLAKLGLKGGIPVQTMAGAEVGRRPGLLNPSRMVKIVELLRQHAAIDDVPQLNVIEVRRPSANYSEVVFTKDTNSFNHFSLLELVAAHYGFVSSGPGADKIFSSSSFTRQHSLAFPDWEQVTIRRAASDGLSRIAVPANLSALFRSGECSPAAPLQWGDVIEIPEADHPIDATWQGLSDHERSLIQKCLARQVSVTVKGQTTNLALSPITSRPSKFTALDNSWIQAASAEFSLLPALRASGLLRPASDLSQVKVHRRDSATGEKSELIFDCSRPDSQPDLWLRNGDEIEVP